MLLIPQILVRTFALGASAVALAACGQQGPLYLPPAVTTDGSRPPERSLPPQKNAPTNATDNSTLPRAPQPATATSAP